MDNASRLLTDLTSWYWWLTAVGLSLLLNLLSSYLKPAIDRWLDARTGAKRAKTEALRAQIDAEASALALNPALIPFAAAEELRLQIQGGVLMIMALSCMLATLAYLTFGSAKASHLVGTTLFMVLWLFLQTTAFRLTDRANLKAQSLSRAKQLVASSGGA